MQGQVFLLREKHPPFDRGEEAPISHALPHIQSGFFFGLPLACFKYTSLVLRNGIQRKKNFPMLSLSPLLIVFLFLQQIWAVFLPHAFSSEIGGFYTNHAWYMVLAMYRCCYLYLHQTCSEKERKSFSNFFFSFSRSSSRPPPPPRVSHTNETAAEYFRNSS